MAQSQTRPIDVAAPHPTKLDTDPSLVVKGLHGKGATACCIPGVQLAQNLPSHMKCLVWKGKENVQVEDKPAPQILHPKDALVKITTTTICGSDLHMYHNEVSGMKKGDILGHEFMGIVVGVGPDVKTLQLGDRVVVSAVIACGECEWCHRQQYSLCDGTNFNNKEAMEEFGDALSGIFGYTHLTGGFAGGQAELARVPMADMTCLKVPENLKDEQVLFLSDILCTAWHANELSNVCEGDTVCVWGLGPVGQLACAWALFRGAKKVIGIDADPFRMSLAKMKLSIDVIDYSKHVDTKSMYNAIREILPNGPDVCIEAAGFRFPKTLAHKVQRALGLEGDSPEILIEMIKACKKGGRISVIGDYFGNANQFPIGVFMEKGLTMAGSQVYVQRYWKKLLQFVEEGRFDPTFIITHTMPFEKAAEAYAMFDKHEDDSLKIILKPTNVDVPSVPPPA